MKYPQIGHIVHKRNVTKCDKCWRMMWNEVLNYKCDHCHRRICVECELSESSDRCIGCSRILCSACDNHRHDCVRCQGYVCPICVEIHDNESSKHHECKNECCIHIRSRRYHKYIGYLIDTDEEESNTSYDTSETREYSIHVMNSEDDITTSLDDSSLE